MTTFTAGAKLRPSDLLPGVAATFYQTSGTVMTTPAGGTETAHTAWTAGSDASVTLKTGRLYRFDCAFGYFDNTSENYALTVRLRKALNNTAAQLLGFWRPTGPTVGAATVLSGLGKCYGKNITGANVTITPGFTVTRTAGTGTVALFGDASIECSVTVYDVGSTSDAALAGRVASAIAIT